MILENSGYWASCKATHKLSFAGGHSVWWHRRDTAGGRGLGLLVQSLSLVLLLSHCQHVPVWPAPGESRGAHSPGVQAQRQLSHGHWHPNP